MQTEIGGWYTHNNKSTHVVVGVENPGDVLSQVSVQHSLDVATDINCGTTAVTQLQVEDCVQ